MQTHLRLEPIPLVLLKKIIRLAADRNSTQEHVTTPQWFPGINTRAAASKTQAVHSETDLVELSGWLILQGVLFVVVCTNFQRNRSMFRLRLLKTAKSLITFRCRTQLPRSGDSPDQDSSCCSQKFLHDRAARSWEHALRVTWKPRSVTLDWDQMFGNIIVLYPK